MTAPKRRWSYSLRTLFVVVTVVGMILAWGAYELNLIRDRLAMAKEIESFGGEVCCYPYNTHPQVGDIEAFAASSSAICRPVIFICRRRISGRQDNPRQSPVSECHGRHFLQEGTPKVKALVATKHPTNSRFSHSRSPTCENREMSETKKDGLRPRQSIHGRKHLWLSGSGYTSQEPRRCSRWD